MIRPVAVKYAFRSLTRSTRRTALSVVGAGVGCAMGVMATSWIRGGADMQIRAASESGAGHVRIVPLTWPETREHTLRLANWEQTLAAVRAVRGLKVAAPRARTNGLLAFGNRTCGVEIVGVDPEVEQASNRIVRRARIVGRYLRHGDVGKTVVGKAVARRLNVEVDDDLYVTLPGRDGIVSAMFRIVGIIETGSEALDEGICHVLIGDVESTTAYAGPGEVSLLLEDSGLMEDTRRELEAALAGANAVVTWKEVNRDLAANVEGDAAFTKIIVGIIIIVVSLGIAGAQLTAVLERRREFAVMSALGMKGRQFFGLLVLESVAIGILGAFVAMLVGGGIAYLLATKGVNIAKFMGGELSMAGVLFDPVMRGSFGAWIIPYAFCLSIAATVAASLYPAWFATRTNPADALRSI